MSSGALHSRSPEAQPGDTQMDQKNGQAASTNGSAIMTIKRAEFLVLVAIVTSAAVVQIRERTLAPVPRLAMRATQATQEPTCGAIRQGIAPADCAVKRDDEWGIDGPGHRRYHGPRFWV